MFFFVVLLLKININNNLFFNTAIELFINIIFLLAFVLAFNTYGINKNNSMLILGAGYFFVSAVGILHFLAYPGIQFISRCSNVAYYALELCDGSKLQERKVIMGYGNCKLLCLIANGLMQWQQVHI